MIPEMLPLAHKTLGHAGVILGSAGVFTAVDFSHTITLGSVLIAIVLAAMAGVFTVRSKIANIWRQEAEGERAAKERAENDLADEKADRVDYERTQLDLRHDLKNELAECRAQLKVMEAKTDLTSALEAIRQMQADAVATLAAVVSDAFIDKSKQEHAETHRLLAEIRDRLPNGG